MGISSVVNEYSLIHYKQLNELKEGSLQERLVVKVDPVGNKSLDIRTLTLWERFQALFDLGPAAKSGVLECINRDPQKEALADKVAFIFDESLNKPRHLVVLSSISQCHNRTLIRELLDRPEVQENLNEKVEAGDTVLMQAIKNNNKDAFKVLVNADGIDLNIWNLEKEYNPLVLAIQKDKVDFVKELIGKGCKIPVKAFLEAKNHTSMLTAIKNATAEQKSGLLVDTVEKNNDAALKKIINDIHDVDMVPALELAIRQDKFEMVDKLLGHGVSDHKALQVAIHEWVKGNSALESGLVQKLIRENKGDEQSQIYELCQMHPAESIRTADEYRQLLATLDTPVEFKSLMKAAERGNWNLVEAMLVEDVVKHYESNGASKILLRAASRAGPEVVKLLLEKGADPLFKDSRGRTARDRAQSRLRLPYIPGGRDQATDVLTLLSQR